jgi:two-component system heavy metal sensor histidine kinase CusS
MALVISSGLVDLMHFLSVRVRLMLLYFTVTCAGLIFFGLLSYGALRYALLEGKKTHLEGREDRLLQLIRENRSKGVFGSLEEQLNNYALVTHEGNLFRVRNPDGTYLFPAKGVWADWALPAEEECMDRAFIVTKLGGVPVLVMCHKADLDGRGVVLHIGGVLDEEAYMLRRYRNALLLLLPLVLLLTSVGGYFLSRLALKPVHRMTRAALDIGVGNLSKRLPVPVANDEIQDLAVAWNQLLTRLEDAVLRLSRFSADASHDLRTSITIMLATAQLSLRRGMTAEEHREDLGRIATECRTASTLLDALLALAQSDNFLHEMDLKKIDLCDLVVNGCRRVEDLAESNGILLDWRLPVERVKIDGDELLLQRLLGILLENAIRYTPAGGEISAEVSISANRALVTVRDSGVGMSEEVRRKVFDRFYQADLRERKSSAGNGLGLSIGKWIADAHGAELTLESTPALGSAFQIRFPLKSTASYNETESKLLESGVPVA